MQGIIVWVVAGHDSSGQFSVFSGQKERGVAMFVKGMLLSIEEGLALNDQRRDPGGIVLINPPGETDERVALFTAGYLGDFYFGHEPYPSLDQNSRPALRRFGARPARACPAEYSALHRDQRECGLP